MKIVLVEWEDTFADVGWAEDDLNPIIVHSVGWVIRKDKRKILLAGMIGTAGLEDKNCRQAIPRGCIRKIQELEIKNPTSSVRL